MTIMLKSRLLLFLKTCFILTLDPPSTRNKGQELVDFFHNTNHTYTLYNLFKNQVYYVMQCIPQ